MVREFKLQAKTHEEIKLGEHTFILPLSDEGILSFSEASEHYQNEIEEANDFDPETGTGEELREKFGILRDIAANFINTIIIHEDPDVQEAGDNFSIVYEEVGRSLQNTFEFITYLSNIYKEYMEDNQKKSQVSAANKYAKNNKNVKSVPSKN